MPLVRARCGSRLCARTPVGEFDYHAPKGASRTIRFEFPGTVTLHPASAQVKLRVPASSTLKASRHNVLNGQTVRFSGRLGLPVLGGLKIAELQAFYRGKWRTFATLRPKAKGTWSYSYRFQATSGLVSYKFRVRIRREASYPIRARLLEGDHGDGQGSLSETSTNDDGARLVGRAPFAFLVRVYHRYGVLNRLGGLSIPI